jgi:hypothetical protein
MYSDVKLFETESMASASIFVPAIVSWRLRRPKISTVALSGGDIRRLDFSAALENSSVLISFFHFRTSAEGPPGAIC